MQWQWLDHHLLNTMTNDSENDKNDHVIRSALTPELTCGTEKPPESEDFKAHRHVSLSALTSLVKTKHQSHSQHLLLLLCSEHCAESGKPHKGFQKLIIGIRDI